MNILLLTLPSNNKNETRRFLKQKTAKIFRFIPPEKIFENLPSFSLLYLSPFLKKDGHSVFYIDGTRYKTMHEIIYFIRQQSIEIVGITSLICNWQNVKRTVKILKQELPHLKVFSGGRYPSNIKEKGLEEIPELDGIVYGEGEHTFREISSRIGERVSLEGVRGSIVKQNSTILINPPRPVIEDLDSLPFPDRELVDEKKYIPPSATYKKLPHTYIYCSRGCTYNCIYCDTEKQLRRRSPANIVDEIEYCNRYHSMKDFSLLDTAASIYRTRIDEICDEILKRGLDISWSMELRVDRVYKDQLKLMKKAGCWKILYGIESGVQKNLDFLNKNISVDQIFSAVSLAREEGIETMGSFMFGVPGETYKEGLETIRLACKLDIDYASFSNMTPFPNTTLEKGLSKWGKVMQNPVFNLSGITFVPHSMTYKELKKLIKKSTFFFYFRIKFILKKIKKIRRVEDLLRLARGLLRVCIRLSS